MRRKPGSARFDASAFAALGASEAEARGANVDAGREDG